MGKIINRLIFLLSILGFVISVFLSYEYNQAGPVPCPVSGGGCETVRQSPYAVFLGLFIPYYGVVFYITIASICVLLVHKYVRLLDLFRIIISFAGFAFGVYITYLEAFVIHAYCFWCVSSFIISVVILVLSLFSFIKQKD